MTKISCSLFLTDSKILDLGLPVCCLSFRLGEPKNCK